MNKIRVRVTKETAQDINGQKITIYKVRATAKKGTVEGCIDANKVSKRAKKEIDEVGFAYINAYEVNIF